MRVLKSILMYEPKREEEIKISLLLVWWDLNIKMSFDYSKIEWIIYII